MKARVIIEEQIEKLAEGDSNDEEITGLVDIIEELLLDRDTLNTIIVNLQHQRRILRHDCASWQTKYQNERFLRLRDQGRAG